MHLAVAAALDIPRQQVRGAIVGALISMAVITGWRVLAETHISVVLQFGMLAVYALTMSRVLQNSTRVPEILGRGLISLGIAGLLCLGLDYQHHTEVPTASAQWVYSLLGAAAVSVLAIGLWFSRPGGGGPAYSGADGGLPRDFADFIQENLAASLAAVEKIRRKTEWDYWKLTALGVPAAALAGLALILSGLAARPPSWPFFTFALLMLLCGIGAGILRWRPSPTRREEILRDLGGYLGLTYYFGGGDAPDHNTATVFGSAQQALDLGLLPPYRELKLGAAFRGSRHGRAFSFGELTTIPPRKLGQNTARLSKNFLLLMLDLPAGADSRTIGIEDRGLLSIILPRRTEAPLLGHATFEEHFTLTAEDIDAARTQLSPAFMDKIMELRRSLPPADVPGFAFDEGRFFLAIETRKDWFDVDPDPGTAMDDPRHLAAILGRLETVLEVVDVVPS